MIKRKSLLLILILGVQLSWTPRTLTALTPGVKTALWGTGTLVSTFGAAIAYLNGIDYQKQLSNPYSFVTEKAALQKRIAFYYILAGAFGSAAIFSAGMTSSNFFEWLRDNPKEQPKDQKTTTTVSDTLVNDMHAKLNSGQEVEIVPGIVWARIVTNKLENKQVLIKQDDGSLAYSSEEKFIHIRAVKSGTTIDTDGKKFPFQKNVILKPINLEELKKAFSAELEKSKPLGPQFHNGHVIKEKIMSDFFAGTTKNNLIPLIIRYCENQIGYF